MSNLSAFVDFVKQQAEYHSRASRAPKNANSPVAMEKHEKLAERFRGLATALQSTPAPQAEPSPFLWSCLPPGEVTDAIKAKPTELSPDYLGGLPPALVAELNITETDRFEANVVRLINGVDGKTMLLDNILIGLYLMTGETHTRINLTNRLYRMARKGKLSPVTGRKGMYTTLPQSASGDAPIQIEDGSETEVVQAPAIDQLSALVSIGRRSIR